ncbi:DDE Tnp4 domain-containing protein [Trichonephila clavipes]|nr:DDE Tnp4 domain-containing protein [Trichonephila clavipes]
MDLIPKMPAFLDKKVQLSTEKANKTRLMTSVRWVVEAVNGHLKSWSALNNIISIVQIPFIGDNVKIICAILNAFHLARLNNIKDDNVIDQ